MRTTLMLLGAFTLALAPLPARAQETTPPPPAEHEAPSDAWFTGPMLAPSAGSLPRGHFLVEPYVFDVHTRHSNTVGSLSYINYGLFDRFTIGVIPQFAFTMPHDGTNSSGLGMGDVQALAQFKLTQFHEGSWIPTTSVIVQQTFPTGHFDHLGDRPSNGLGSGAYATMLGLYAQTYFWMGNGRILRTRVDASETFSNDVRLSDVSVYGTGDGFRGQASPGNSFFIDNSYEYSMTQRWVLAVDLTYRHTGSTRVWGYDNASSSIDVATGSSDGYGIAPGIEYSWKPTIGVIAATRLIPSSHNTSWSVTPAIAINMVY